MVVSEYTGGGFGSKITGAISLIIPALLSKKCNAPVMMRHQREEETFIGRARPSMTGRMKVGFSKEGRSRRSTCTSGQTTGLTIREGDAPSSGRIVSLLYQPRIHAVARAHCDDQHPAARAQSSPGGMQGITIMEPIVSKAARKLGIDQVAIRNINAPEGKAPFGPPRYEREARLRDQRIRQGSARTAALSNSTGTKRVARNPKRIGTKVRGVGVAMGCYRRRLCRIRRAVVDQAGREHLLPIGNRQSRDRIGDRRPSRRRGNARRAVGEVRRLLGHERQEPAVVAAYRAAARPRTP